MPRSPTRARGSPRSSRSDHPCGPRRTSSVKPEPEARARPSPSRFQSFAPFRHRDFALFWSGAFVSNIGTWMETVAFGVYVTSRTGQVVWPGLVAAAAFVPTAFLGPVGGAVADRMPRQVGLLL